jgi:hypothetical protein
VLHDRDSSPVPTRHTSTVSPVAYTIATSWSRPRRTAGATACPSGRYDEIGSAVSSTSTCRLHEATGFSASAGSGRSKSLRRPACLGD